MEIFVVRVLTAHGAYYDNVFPTKEKALDFVDLRNDLRVELLHMEADDSRLLFELVNNNYHALKNLFTLKTEAVDKQSPWYVYIVQCSDGTLYTGVTTDLERRVYEHNNGTGAKYTRTRTPVKLLTHINCYDKGEALSLEASIKKKSRTEKLKLIAENKNK